MPLTISPLTCTIAAFTFSILAGRLLHTVYKTYLETGFWPAAAVLMHTVLTLLM